MRDAGRGLESLTNTAMRRRPPEDRGVGENLEAAFLSGANSIDRFLKNAFPLDGDVGLRG